MDVRIRVERTIKQAEQSLRIWEGQHARHGDASSLRLLLNSLFYLIGVLYTAHAVTGDAAYAERAGALSDRTVELQTS